MTRLWALAVVLSHLLVPILQCFEGSQNCLAVLPIRAVAVAVLYQAAFWQQAWWELQRSPPDWSLMGWGVQAQWARCL